MLPILAATILFHAFGLWKAYKFFRNGTSRNSDRSVVAALMLGSVVVIVVLVAQMTWGFETFESSKNFLESSLLAVSLFNGVIYQAVIHTYSEHREMRHDQHNEANPC